MYIGLIFVTSLPVFVNFDVFQMIILHIISTFSLTLCLWLDSVTDFERLSRVVCRINA